MPLKALFEVVTKLGITVFSASNMNFSPLDFGTFIADMERDIPAAINMKIGIVCGRNDSYLATVNSLEVLLILM